MMILLTGAAGAQGLRIDPSIHFRLSHSDNVRAGSDSRRSGLVAQVTPGVGLATTRAGGRITAQVNTRLGGVIRTHDRDRSNASLGLQGRASVEAVEERLFVDLDAAIRRTNLSLFEGRTEDDFLVTERRNETRSFAVAPRLEFRLGTLADGRLRYESRWLDGASRAIAAQRLHRWDANLGSATAFGPLGWGLNYSRSDSGYDDRAIADVRQEAVRATLFYSVTPQLRVHGNVGRERNDFGASRSESHRIVGGGFSWFPTPRTSFAASVEDRFFGTGYDLSLSHRRAKSHWLLSYGRDVSSSLRRFGSVFQDPFFLELFNDPSYNAQFPDPLEREDAIRQILGLTGDAFVSSAHFVDRRARAAVSLIGVRNTLTLSAQRSDRERLSGVMGLRAGDEFRDAERVRTTSLSTSLSHRLSAASSLNATLTRAQAERGGGNPQQIRRWVAVLGYSVRLGPKTTAGLSYRFQKAEGATDFRENLLTANLGLRF